MYSQSQDVIEFSLLLTEESISDHSSHEGGSFEKSSWVLGVKGQELSGGLSDTSQHQLDSPDLSLVLETEFTDQKEPWIKIKFLLAINTFLFERSSWGL